MRVLKFAFAGLALFFALVIGYGFMLPSTTMVSRNIALDFSAEKIFKQINSLKNFSQWSPWAQYDPKMQTTFNGPDEGVGAVMSWQSEHPQVGHGSQRISESEANRYVKMPLTFSGVENAYAEWFINEQDNNEQDKQVNVEWRFTMEHENVFGRYIGLLMDGMVGTEYEKGLQNLQAFLDDQ